LPLLAVHDEFWVKVWLADRLDEKNARREDLARRLLGETLASDLKSTFHCIVPNSN
jgi:hypothetical protein